MKKTFTILTLVAALFAASCQEKVTFVPELTVTASGVVVEEGAPGKITIDYRGGSTTIRVQCNTKWSADCQEDWIELTPSDNSLKIVAEANPVFSLRTATITISVEGYPVSRVVEVSQGADTPFIRTTPTSLEFTKDGGDKTLTVEANCAWTVSVSKPFIQVNPTSGNAGTTIITVSADTNSGIEELQAILTIKSGDEAAADVTITQMPDLTGYYVDENGINRGKGITIDGKIWAPVNCGYSEPKGEEAGNPYGKYYQWGRKAGFAYNDEGENIDSGERINVDGPVASVDEAVDNEFYKNSANWLAEKINDLWNKGTEAAPVKTEYDPCPQGWRVPTETEMLALLANNSATVLEGAIHGRWVSGSVAYTADAPQIFLAFAGDIATGSNSELRDDSGFYWTSTVRDNSDGDKDIAIQIYLKGWVGMNDWTNQRARAYPIRCIAE